MKLSIFAILVTLWASLLVGAWSNDSAHATPVHINSHDGTPFSPSPRANQTDEPDTAGPLIPTGTPRGPIQPSSPAMNVTMMSGGDNTTTSHARRQNDQCGGNGTVFGNGAVFGTTGSRAAEPSGAKAGKVLFTTANWFAAISVDNGVTWNSIDPTVYTGPANQSTDGGFCCDQVVHYLPSINRFVWLIQYLENAKSVNKLRVITFHPSDVDAGGIRAWIYLDIVSTDLQLNGPFDYGDLAVGDSELYVSATNSGTGLVVIRIPIAALDVVGPLTYWYTDPKIGSVAIFSHLSQNPGDTVFWAGHSTIGTTMRVFKWPESGTIYFWNDIRINDWPSSQSNFVSPCPGAPSTNWVFDAQFHDIIGVTRRSTNEVWFAWPAPSGGGFPNLHIQIAQVNTSSWPTLDLIKQWQIWNPDFVFGYPALYTNTCGDVGIAVAFGGGKFNPSSAVGIADSNGVLTQTVYYPELSDVCADRFGDYLTVRQGEGAGYVGFIFAGKSIGGGAERRPRFLEFGRG